MKKLIVSLSLLATVSMIACQKDSDQQDQIAAVPQSACMTKKYAESNCNYNYQQNTGWANYPTNNQGYYTGYDTNYQSGFCGCQSGYYPAYNSQNGMGCVDSYYVSQVGYTPVYFQWDTRRYAFTIDQYTSYQASNGCQKTVVSSCVIGAANSCGWGGSCVPVGQGALGICVYR